ncbi:inositol monophosphatase family protein [Calycomorphotria hydatis]|uniref:Inositol-1-monophosphatase n=1 Tax=Calycomorphotria hydatis TaxID=2528027 RepID=A0A517T365_9PLAN|nr:inositol monophosphatase family protein [Calycomorphotria hydatis]QDT62806.1 Inositol-1-monophosphatase [Calycomorphotria hydatis]
MSLLDVTHQAAQAGGEVIERYFREGVEIRTKEGAGVSYDLVSDADLESEKAIGAVIQKAFPEHSILGEETFQDSIDAEHLWIIDPLDGTNNFAHDIPHFAISVAYYHNGQAETGVVLNPITGDCFAAKRGEGATLNGEPIRVGPQQKLDEVFVGCGFYYDRGAMMEATLASIKELFHEHIHGIRRMGTASLDLCFVAAGRFGAFFEYQLSPWDYAAGRLIVEEAGGSITDCGGNPLPLEKTSVLASNTLLHEAVLRIVRANEVRN